MPNPYKTNDEQDATEAALPESGILPTLFAVLLVGLLLFMVTVYVTARPAVDRTLLSKVESGMTKQQVTSILGRPNQTSGDSEWLYWRWGNAGWVEVWFDDLDHVELSLIHI